MSYCVSVVVVNPAGDPAIDGMPLFDRPPLTEEESTFWVTPPNREPFRMWSPGRHRFIGPLMIEESLPHKGQAGYVPGLRTDFPGDWEGRGYFLYADTGRRVPETSWAASRRGKPIFDSEPLVIPSWDDEDEDFDLWGRLAIRGPFRQPADMFLRSALGASQVRRVYVVCEYNGNVTDHRSEETLLLGPLTLNDFWREHDAKRITIPSLVAIEEDREQLFRATARASQNPHAQVGDETLISRRVSERDPLANRAALNGVRKSNENGRI